MTPDQKALVEARELLSEHLQIQWGVPRGAMKSDVPLCHAIPVDTLHRVIALLAAPAPLVKESDDPTPRPYHGPMKPSAPPPTLTCGAMNESCRNLTTLKRVAEAAHKSAKISELDADLRVACEEADSVVKGFIVFAPAPPPKDEGALDREVEGTTATERLQAIIDWADFALADPAEFNGHGVRNLTGPVFDAARDLLNALAAGEG